MLDNLAPIQEQVLPALSAPLAGALQASPYNFEFTGDDYLKLTVENSFVGVRVTVSYRMHRRDNVTAPSSESFAITADRVANTFTFNIGQGYLLNAVAFVSSGAPKRGQTYIKLEAIRGANLTPLVLAPLLQGYVTANQNLGYPGSPLQGSFEGDGFTRFVSGTQPAAGNEWSETVPTGARWELLNLAVDLTTNGTPADRLAVLGCRNAGQLFFRSPQTRVIPAGRTIRNYWTTAAAVNPSVKDDVPVAQLAPGLQLHAGHTFDSGTSNLQAGDAYGAPFYQVREWLEV